MIAKETRLWGLGVLHGKVDLTRAKGLKKSQLNQLDYLLKQRLPTDKILTNDFVESLAEITHEIGQAISVVVNRRGQVINVTLGQPWQVNMPELRQVRVGPGRLCGHRVIYSRLVNQENGNNNKSGISNENLHCLAKNRLDIMAQINVLGGQEKLSPSKLINSVQLVHLLPGRDSEGNLWKIFPASDISAAEEEDFSTLIESLEEEFRRDVPGLPVAKGEERAILVDLITEGMDPWQVEDDLDELTQLARTAGATVSGRLTQARNFIDPHHFLGSGKVQELALLVQEQGANLVVFDRELTAQQHTTLQKMIGVKILDRTELILDIFAKRAQTKEGKLQVELAQLKYLLPRLIGKGVQLSRLGGGIGTRGPGETKLEIDRRRIRDRINALEKETEHIKKYRDMQRRRRMDNRTPVVALTGYTNSGKSTLLNAVTKSDVFVENKLFATLDPTTRRTILPDRTPVLLCDTVGFIKKLPTSLVAAFKSTLEEVFVADILLHVVDSSHPNVIDQINSVYDVLSDLEAIDKPIITVLNKADIVRKEDLLWLISQVPNPVIVSALQKQGLGLMLQSVQDMLQEIYPVQVARETA